MSNIYKKDIKGLDIYSVDMENNYNNPIKLNTYRNNANNYSINPLNIFKISFKVESSPFAILLKLDPNTTIDQMLKQYLLKIRRKELYNHNEKIIFISEEKSLKFGDQTTIENFFTNTNNKIKTKEVLVSFT